MVPVGFGWIRKLSEIKILIYIASKFEEEDLNYKNKRPVTSLTPPVRPPARLNDRPSTMGENIRRPNNLFILVYSKMKL